MKKPVVSVVMATYNEPECFLKDAIESILFQTEKSLELIIIDDSTQPDSIKVIDSYKTDKRVSIIRKVEKFGFVNALNEGLKKAKGQFIARMDADDIALEDRIKKQIHYFQTHPNVDVLGGNIIIVNKDGKEVSRRRYANTKIQIRLKSIFRSPVAHPTVMFRRDIVDQNFFYNNSFKKAEDTEFWFRLRNNGFKLANMNQYLLKFRITGDLATKRTSQHFYYNHKARSKNFSWKYFYVDIPSFVISKVYSVIPQKIKSTYYSLENKK